jgi:hypothetical protein
MRDKNKGLSRVLIASASHPSHIVQLYCTDADKDELLLLLAQWESLLMSFGIGRYYAIKPISAGGIVMRPQTDDGYQESPRRWWRG